MEINKRAEDMTDDELATIAAQGLPKAKQAEPQIVREFGPVDASKH
jgi:hypothetical protein